MLHTVGTVSVSSGITMAVRLIAGNVGLLPVLLAENLPRASNYFLTYVPLHAFVAAVLVQLKPIELFSSILPRRWTWLQPSTPGPDACRTEWETILPIHATLASIGES